ncbi:unnamed protein product [Peronospora belbahrii]|uniref:BZIP domain-containing protein n=1 Tax=Peronospora belbahrii TaxID=622444 RepID=A0AAU9KGU6_9STRA|nr:unnamed protein product [Peronospora belbahrii]CAH0521782.1 unnamed protein product [Peronospora belbahrii]
MASMSLNFILCEPEEVLAARTCEHQSHKLKSSSMPLKNNHGGVSFATSRSSSLVFGQQADPSDRTYKTVAKIDRRQHARQLQNLRQRRYRERKKSSASALQSNLEQLQQENLALEDAILEYFKSQGIATISNRRTMDIQLE